MNPQLSDDTAPSDSGWPAEGLESVPRCPVCESGDREVLYEGMTDRVFFCAPGQWTLHRCRQCGSAYLDPRPTLATIHLAHKRYYTHTEPKIVPTQELSALRRFGRALANGYRNQRYGASLRPATAIGVLVMRLWTRYRERMDRELRYLPRVWPGARLLDVGFGDGAFLELAGRVGWTVAGADPDHVAVENAKARGLEVRQGGIDTFADQPERFDIITMSHVIEHVHDPQDTLQQSYRLLRPGGRLYLETPNIEAIGHAEFGAHWRGLEVPRHITIFTWPALERLLAKTGFGATERLRQTHVYPGLAAESRAMSRARDPFKYSPLTIRDRLVGIIVNVRTRINHRHSEFIALIAHKPR